LNGKVKGSEKETDLASALLNTRNPCKVTCGETKVKTVKGGLLMELFAFQVSSDHPDRDTHPLTLFIPLGESLTA